MTKVLKIKKEQSWFLQKTVVLTFLLFSSLFASAQQQKIVVKGKVFDDKTNEVLIGASIKAKKPAVSQGTVSDVNGNFSIDAKSLPITLTISNTGYREQEIDVYEYTEPITILLQQDLNSLNSVLVVGYGTQKRSELTGSISSIPKSNLSQITTSFDNLLSGAVSGLNVTQSSGQPGATSSVRIRGGNSINGGNEPLYVIDGFIVYNDNNSSNTGVGKAASELNVLATINPSDIESVEVLKDASATAIYGSRGANGVILITTKKGSKGSGHISYQGSFGWQQISKKLDFLNAKDWASLYNDILTSQNLPKAFTQNQIDQLGEGSDWQSAALQKGAIKEHQLSITGGDDKTRYAISGDYLSQDGIIKNTGFDRYSARVNFDRDVFDNFKIGINILGSVSKQNVLSYNSTSINNGDAPNTWVSIIRALPVVSIYNADGSYNYTNPYSDEAVNGVTANPISDLLNTIDETRANRTLGNFYAEYKVIPSLTAKVNVGADLLNTKQNYYAPSYTTGGISTNGYASVGNKVVNSYQAEFTLNYEKEWKDKHSLNVLAGYTTQKSDAESAVATSTNFSNDATTYNSLQSASTAVLPGSSASTSILNSYLGRINYSYLHRYNLTTSLRADGSSRFAPNHEWGYFPSVGLSWNINNESFLKKYKDISNLKLRLSAGTNGNQEIGDYQYLSQLTPAVYSLNGSLVTGYATTNIANPDLKWEQTNQYDAGFDLGLWDNRVNFVTDLYYKKTSDLLLTEPIPLTSGYSSALENIGAVSNKGIEIALNADIIKEKGQGFNWTTNLTFAKNINKVLSLGNLSSFIPTFSSTGMNYASPTIVEVGQPLGSFYGFVFDGIVQTGDDLTKVPVNSWAITAVKPGDTKYVDQNNSKTIDSNDKVILGNSQPKFTYGFTNTFTYKNFDLSVVFQGSYGNKLYNALRNRSELTSLYFNSLSTVKDRWTTTNASTEIAAAANSSAYYVDSRYIEDASFLKLRSLVFGYTYPLHLGKQKKATPIRVFFDAQNLLTFTHYSGYDPEASQSGGNDEQSSLYQGVDYGAYPSAKSFSFGLRITL
jgi:TonB-dependent starch-binding outer membrane protein SusC